MGASCGKRDAHHQEHPTSLKNLIAALKRPPTGYQIYLLIYSGMPNPQWQITTESHPELCAQLDARPPTDCLPSHLGYAGFMVMPIGVRYNGNGYFGAVTKDIQLQLLDSMQDEAFKDDEEFKHFIWKCITGDDAMALF